VREREIEDAAICQESRPEGAIWPLETETAAKLVVIRPRGMGMAMPRRSPVAG
jgi:hypothetical protein